MSDVLVVLSTFPSAEKAAEVARVLVDEQLCACVTMLPGVRSIYRWEGVLEDSVEVLAMFKTTRAAYDRFERRLLALHPYEVPELIALEGSASNRYGEWVSRVVS